MPYIIPSAAIGAGVALSIWGSRRWIDGNDSADRAAAKVIRAVPEYFAHYVENVEVTSNGVKVKLKENAPDTAVHEAERNIEVEDRPNGVNVHR